MAPRRRRTGPTDVVRRLVRERDGGHCVRCSSTRSPATHHQVDPGVGSSCEEGTDQAGHLLLVRAVRTSWSKDRPSGS